MSVAELLQSRTWEEMSGSPGRFRLAEPGAQPGVEELLGPGIARRELPSADSPDVIVLAEFDDGGLISYRRANGTWLHTLNTRTPFRRKLWELGIAKRPRPRFWDAQLTAASR